MPAVGSSCIFEEVLPIVAALLRRSGEAKKRAGVQQKKNRGIGQKQKFESSKAGCSKRIAYFCTCRQTLRLGQLLMRLAGSRKGVRIGRDSTAQWFVLSCPQMLQYGNMLYR